MTVIDIKGVRIGEGRPKTIVSLMATRGSEIVPEVNRLTIEGLLGRPDCIEWRADFFDQVREPDAVAGTCFFLSEEINRQPLIFTCRTRGQGGKVNLSADAYAELLTRVITLGAPDLVDIELGVGDELVGKLVKLAQASGVRTIVSHHDFVQTPDTAWMVDCLTHMAALGADIPKLAVMARDKHDADRLMEASTTAARQLDMPLITMAMGTAGAITRILGEKTGSAMTFCAMGEPSAPGQLSLKDTLARMDEVHAALA